MRSAAELLGEGARLDDADELAVLLSEQGKDTRLARRRERRLVCVYGKVGHDDVIANALDLENLLMVHGLEMREIEAQPVRGDERSGLLHVLSEDIGQRTLQDVRRRVVARDEGAAACVDGGVHDIALVNAPGDDRAVMDGQALLGPFGVIDGDGAQVVRYGAGVAHLAAHLAVERRLVEYDGDLLAFMGLVDDRAVDDDVDDARVAFVLLVTHELGGAMHVEDVREDVAEAVPGLVIASCACPFALGRHLVFEALHVDLDALLVADLGRELDGEPVRVVQGEGGDAVEDVSLVQALDRLLEIVHTRVDGAIKALLLGEQHLLDERLVLDDLGIDRAHLLADGVEEALEEGTLDADETTMAYGTAQQATQDVATALVRGQDAVTDHEDDGAGMIRHDAQREIGELVAAVAATAQPFAHLDETMQDVGVEVRAHTLHDSGHALEAQTRVDVLLLEGNHRAVFLTVELREDEVPVLEEAVAIATGLAVGAAAPDILSLIVVELRARTAGTGGTGDPEIVIGAETGDMAGVDPHLLPDAGGLLVFLVDGDVDAIGVEAEHVDRELVGPGAHLLLEVRAKTEVAEHLEEGKMPAIGADDVDVIGPHALLRRRRAHVARVKVLLLQEIRLELDHARNREQQGRVIGDERGRGPALTALLLEEVQVRFANLGRRGGYGRHDAPCPLVLLYEFVVQALRRLARRIGRMGPRLVGAFLRWRMRNGLAARLDDDVDFLDRDAFDGAIGRLLRGLLHGLVIRLIGLLVLGGFVR